MSKHSPVSDSPFQEVHLSWDDEDYVIPPDRVLAAIACVEEVITLPEIHRMASRNGAFKFVQISSAYASLLRFAGAPRSVDAQSVYVGMFQGEGHQERIMAAITGLMAMMVPPAPSTGGTSPGKARGRGSRATGSSSGSRTRSRSGQGGSAARSSGRSTQTSSTG